MNNIILKMTFWSIIFISISNTGFCQVNEVTFNHVNFDSSSLPRNGISPMSLRLLDNYNNGGPSDFSTILEIYGLSSHQTGQLSFGGWDNSKIRYRQAFYAENSWSDWVTLLDSRNNIESSGLLRIFGEGNHYISNGNLGIGTITPSDKLEVNGDAKATNFNAKPIAYGSSGAIKFKSTDNNSTRWNIYNYTNGDATYGSLNFSLGNGTDVAVFKSTGLDLNGSLNVIGNVTGSQFQLVRGNGAVQKFADYTAITNNVANLNLYSQYGNNVPSLGLTITGANSPNVGIGTTTPDEKLAVKGKIHAEEVKVDLSVPGPDYVFEKKYSLQPLAELQEYIQVNKHLPEVPSAKEMEKNGINLSEMNMLLLKKVEELTLHLIELESANTKLRLDFEEFKNKVK